jgi:hypothetical protein
MPVPAKPTPPWRRGDDLTAAPARSSWQTRPVRGQLNYPRRCRGGGGCACGKGKAEPGSNGLSPFTRRAPSARIMAGRKAIVTK